MLNGETLGAESSTATHHDAIYQPLYVFLWDNVDEAQLGMSEAKGETALVDWQAGKTIHLPDLRGRSVIGAGLGNRLTGRALGSIGGNETHQLTINEMPSHSHSLPNPIIGSGSGTVYGDYYEHSGHSCSSSSTNVTGGNAAHNNMPPWLALSWIIKY